MGVDRTPESRACCCTFSGEHTFTLVPVRGATKAGVAKAAQEAAEAGAAADDRSAERLAGAEAKARGVARSYLQFGKSIGVLVR